MKKLFSFLFLSSTLLLSSCRTGGVIIRETPLGISETRKSVVSVVGQPRGVSENGREVLSQYYDKKNKNIEKMDMARERYYTQVIILGDRRPYDVQVQVMIESRNEDGGFDLIDHDDDRAAVIADKIRRALNQSRDTRNVIDDFRSF